ncbi:hypothetical protein C7B77_04870 [Chamaesiphon polymorphus CCALA 037]|uniref:PEP-CTERM sorting domain-containing protein n=2 Tax=Chamaesiphon TaxID=217161 RepID=A0A2T1GKR9_9CYAN|nr:hypothetical protein C7B77_04870 [Chamaesiphon polymorphus CCALA 037]
MLAVGSLAVGLGTVAYAAPAQAAFLFNSDLSFGNANITSFFSDVNPGAGDTIAVTFATPTDVGSSGGILAGTSFFPTISPATIPGMYALSPVPTATFNYVAGNSGGFIYSLASDLVFNFSVNGSPNGLSPTTPVSLTIAGGTQFTGSSNPTAVAFSTITPTGSFFQNGGDKTFLNALSFSLNDTLSGGKGTFGITASTVAPPTTTQVPEPFTIVGTIIGGTAALRMRKKLAKAAQN